MEDPPVVGTNVHPKCGNFVVDIQDQTATIIRILSSSGNKHKIQLDFPSLIVSWFETHYGQGIGSLKIQLYTEIVLKGQPGQKGVTLRAHPNYQSAGAWYDYALASYTEDNREDKPTYPCKMVCFFKEPNTGKTMALVQEVQFQTQGETARESQLFKHWTLISKDNRANHRRDAVFVVMDVESLSDRIYVVDPKPVGGFSREVAADFNILVVKYVKEEWPTSFLDSANYLDSYTWDG
jgi:hypothetical protein